MNKDQREEMANLKRMVRTMEHERDVFCQRHRKTEEVRQLYNKQIDTLNRKIEAIRDTPEGQA